MLEVLRIQNLALMETVEVEFGGGLNMVTGETGSGKSNLLEGIELLLGSRGRLDLIRKGAEACTVEGVFDLGDPKKSKWIHERLEAQGLESSDGKLFVRRVLHASGKNRVYLNGALCSLQQLQHVTQGLIDYCSQHEHQSLIRPAVQLELLDVFGKTVDDSQRLQEWVREHQEWLTKIERSTQQSSERDRRREFLVYQIQEIENAELLADEDASLSAEKKRLQSGVQRKQAIEAVLDVFVGEAFPQGEHSSEKISIGQALNRGETTLRHMLQNLGLQDEGLSSLVRSIEKLRWECDEVAEQLQKYEAGIEMDPERLAWVEERLDVIQQLKRKYGPDLKDVFRLKDELKAELAGIEHSSEDLAHWTMRAAESKAKAEAAFGALLKRRHKAARELSLAVTRELKDLCIDHAVLEIHVRPMENFRTEVEFMIRTNKGEDLHALAQTASGGELSRVMLAIRRVCSDAGRMGVYLFDEIDAGLGGAIAFHVGRKLRSVAKDHQILCVTHLPQVAAFAQHHWVVVKSGQGAGKGERTVSRVARVTGKSQADEIARMMGGPQVTPLVRQGAYELLRSAALPGARSGGKTAGASPI